MPRTDNLYQLPENLPLPVDDGATNHLLGLQIPSIPLMSTAGIFVDLGSISGRTIVYCYPRTGKPDANVPRGWNEIPGARGCTPQSCAFRDRYQELQALGARCFGLSTQTTEYQQEAVRRLHLPFDINSGYTGMIKRRRLLECPYNNIVGTRHCRLLISAGNNSDATGFDMIC